MQTNARAWPMHGTLTQLLIQIRNIYTLRSRCFAFPVWKSWYSLYTNNIWIGKSAEILLPAAVGNVKCDAVGAPVRQQLFAATVAHCISVQICSWQRRTKLTLKPMENLRLGHTCAVAKTTTSTNRAQMWPVLGFFGCLALSWLGQHVCLFVSPSVPWW